MSHALAGLDWGAYIHPCLGAGRGPALWSHASTPVGSQVLHTRWVQRPPPASLGGASQWGLGSPGQVTARPSSGAPRAPARPTEHQGWGLCGAFRT